MMSNVKGKQFSPEERQAIYRVIRERRDVRLQFLSDPIPDDVLGRVLDAAHHAPSVGFMQPWDFILIESASVRTNIHAHFQQMKERANIYEGERRNLYSASKLAGILDAPLNICVTCDRERAKGHGLGRQSDPMTDIYSTVCAVQNFWLAARAESLGVGWVSILDLDAVKELLNIPAEIQNRPGLEESGWETRDTLANLIHFDSWSNRNQHRAAAICTPADDSSKSL
jgi:5,6-dimethylbenzimidazole synthase